MEFGLQLQVVLVFPQGNQLLEFTVTTLFQRINVSLEINVHFALALKQQEPTHNARWPQGPWVRRGWHQPLTSAQATNNVLPLSL